ncbi:protein AMBP-like [Poecilia reticulata]|uniref:Protein AMBP-like n=1 Tax=Poecilia reticulata TaxID=8081 RepID=A0A3P9NRC1_POERE|nr:PREDICTED: protein AMBP-like [Poecilia reticulata]
MQRVVFLVPLLVVGSTWTHQMDPVIENSPVRPMENFDFEQFIGRWYEMAVLSTCPHYMQRKKRNPVIVALDLKHVPTQHNFTMTSSTFKNGTCVETLTVYSLTSTPGRFFHHVARFGADVDSFVIRTNYDEYALMLQLSTEQPSGNKTTTVKLYGRTTSVSRPVLDQFNALIRHHEMSEDAAIMNQHKGDCFSGKQLMEKTANHQAFAPQISRQNITTEEKQNDV